MRLLSACLCVTITCAAAREAAAQERLAVAKLDWQAPADCASAEAVRAAVNTRLGRRALVAEEPADVTVRGRTSGDDGRWEVLLELVRRDQSVLGSRVLASPARDCSSLDESLALVIALMVDVPVEEVQPPPQQPVQTEPPRPPVPRRIAIPEPQAPLEPWNVEPGVFGAINYGLIPGLGLGAGLGVLIDPPRFWPLELQLSVWATAEAHAADSAQGSRFRLITAGVWVCPVEAPLGTAQALVCIGQTVGTLRTEGFGFDSNRAERRMVYDAGLRGRLSWPLSQWLRLIPAMSAEVPLSRDRFFARSEDAQNQQIFAQSPVVLTAELGVGLSLP